MRQFLPIFIFAILLISCVYDPPLKRLDINGYTCGDTIDDGITVTEIATELISYGVINEYDRARVWLFNNHIERIIIDSLSPEEYKSMKTRVTKIYNIDPYYCKDSLFGGLKIPVEEYYWYDSMSRDRVSLMRSTQDNPDSLSQLWFENQYVAETYREWLLGPEEEYEFIIMSDEE